LTNFIYMLVKFHAASTLTLRSSANESPPWARVVVTMLQPISCQGGTPMPTKCARYHGYALDIFGPNGEAGRWKVHVWPPSRKPPIIVPAQASEDDAMTVAKIIIDYLLVSSRQPAA
jgi:hypothetical protein